MFDLAILNGTIVDGTGAPRYRGNVYVRGGRIARLSDAVEPAAETIDAEGKIVSPGFIDVHTHYDAQAFWDPTLSPSSFHGVTTIFGGFCGFSIAPLSKDSASYLMPMLAMVEGIPIEALEAGVPWDWSSFGDYLGKLDGKLAINAGFLCGHSALRRHVMGERAVGDTATAEEIEQMKELLRESIRGGALGFSSSRSITHSDGNSDPVPSRHASMEELLALYAVVDEFEGTIAEIAPPSLDFTPETHELLTQTSLAARRPVNWNLMSASSRKADEMERVAQQLEASAHARRHGARVVGLTLPQTPRIRLNMLTGVILNTIPGWAPLFKLPVAERIAQLRDPEQQRIMKEGAAQMTGVLANIGNFAKMKVVETFAEENKPHEGRIIRDIAAEDGRDPFDIFLDIAIADGLRTSFTPGYQPDTHEAFEVRTELWTHPDTVIGGSDAGAHLDMIDTFAITTELLGSGVREHGMIALEQAVHLLTLQPARFMGLKERGQISEGWHADIVVFDADSIGAEETYTRDDLPSGALRVYAEASGIHHVIVNGREIIRDNEYLDVAAGTILRPGISTETVAIPADLESAANG